MAELATFVFDTTTAALWGEEVAVARGIPAELVSAPASSDAKCDLALVTHDEHAPALEQAFAEEGVRCRRWS